MKSMLRGVGWEKRLTVGTEGGAGRESGDKDGGKK